MNVLIRTLVRWVRAALRPTHLIDDEEFVSFIRHEIRLTDEELF